MYKLFAGAVAAWLVLGFFVALSTGVSAQNVPCNPAVQTCG